MDFFFYLLICSYRERIMHETRCVIDKIIATTSASRYTFFHLHVQVRCIRCGRNFSEKPSIFKTRMCNNNDPKYTSIQSRHENNERKKKCSIANQWKKLRITEFNILKANSHDSIKKSSHPITSHMQRPNHSPCFDHIQRKLFRIRNELSRIKKETFLFENGSDHCFGINYFV